MNIKEIIKKHMLTICAVISIIAMAFPFIIITSSVDSEYVSASSNVVTSGFSALGKSFFSIILIVGPALVATMNYIKPIEKYKGILAIIIPVICIIDVVIVYLQVKGVTVSASAAGGAYGAETKASLGIGAIIAILSYIGTAIAGAVTYHGFKFDKESLEKLKSEGASFAKNMSDKISDTAHEVASNINEKRESATQANADNCEIESSARRATSKPSKTNISRTEEILVLIEKLNKMKIEGMLTEEEFAEKKKQLLEEI